MGYAEKRKPMSSPEPSQALSSRRVSSLYVHDGHW